MTDPSLEYRLLAVFRLWNVFHYFHPYIELAGDWGCRAAGIHRPHGTAPREG